jgi:hypothetical protein
MLYTALECSAFQEMGHDMEGPMICLVAQRLQADGVAATLAATAAQLESVDTGADMTEQLQDSPQEESKVLSEPINGADKTERLDSPATPWQPEIGIEASALAAALAVKSRSATPAGRNASPAAARSTPRRRCAACLLAYTRTRSHRLAQTTPQDIWQSEMP